MGWFLMAGGVFAICGAVFDWDWFMNHRRARLFVRVFTRSGARIFYGLLGGAILFAGMISAMGIVQESDWRPETLEFLDGEFTVLRPATWSIMTDLHDDADVQMGSFMQGAFCMILSNSKADFWDGVDLEWFSSTTSQKVIESHENSEVTGPEMLTYGDQPAIRYVIDEDLEGMMMRIWHVSIDSETHLHQVIMWSELTDFSENRVDLEAVLESIRRKEI
jgi:hypothetical protein